MFIKERDKMEKIRTEWFKRQTRKQLCIRKGDTVYEVTKDEVVTRPGYFYWVVDNRKYVIVTKGS